MANLPPCHYNITVLDYYTYILVYIKCVCTYILIVLAVHVQCIGYGLWECVVVIRLQEVVIVGIEPCERSLRLQAC